MKIRVFSFLFFFCFKSIQTIESIPLLNIVTSDNKVFLQWVVVINFTLSSQKIITQHHELCIIIHTLLLFSGPVVSNSLRAHKLQRARPPCPSPSPEVCPNLSLLHQ